MDLDGAGIVIWMAQDILGLVRCSVDDGIVFSCLAGAQESDEKNRYSTGSVFDDRFFVSGHLGNGRVNNRDM